MHPDILNVLSSLFLSSHVLKVGFAIAGDFTRLRRDFPSLPEPTNWLDLAFLQTAERWRAIAHAESDRAPPAQDSAQQDGAAVTLSLPSDDKTRGGASSGSVKAVSSTASGRSAAASCRDGEGESSIADDAEEDALLANLEERMSEDKEQGTAGSLTPARASASARSMSIAETEQTEQ